jgi:hypothetical protein
VKTKLLCLSLLFTVGVAHADAMCVNSCMGGGRSYATCTNICNIRDGGGMSMPELVIPKPVHVDYGCMNNCTSSGNGYQYCQSRCSY